MAALNTDAGYPKATEVVPKNDGKTADAATKPVKVRAEGAKKILASEIAAPFRAEIQAAVRALPDGIGPKLVGFLANDDPAARQYAEWTGKTLTKDLLRFELREVAEHELEDALEKANSDPEVHGIMIYYPVFGGRPSFHGPSMDDYLRDTVSLFKDVEGLCHYYRRSLYRNKRFVAFPGSATPAPEQAESGIGRKCVLPCTPLAVVKVLEHLGVYDASVQVGDRMQNKTVVVVNRSEVVGRPLAAMLANDGATVYSIDIDSIYTFQRGKLEVPPESSSLETVVPKADVVILGVPSDKFKLDVSLVKEGAIVVNVAFQKNVDEEELLSKVKNVRYVGAVGAVTVAMLERNLLRLHHNFTGTDCSAWSADLASVALSASEVEQQD